MMSQTRGQHFPIGIARAAIKAILAKRAWAASQRRRHAKYRARDERLPGWRDDPQIAESLSQELARRAAEAPELDPKKMASGFSDVEGLRNLAYRVYSEQLYSGVQQGTPEAVAELLALCDEALRRCVLLDAVERALPRAQRATTLDDVLDDLALQGYEYWSAKIRRAPLGGRALAPVDVPASLSHQILRSSWARNRIINLLEALDRRWSTTYHDEWEAESGEPSSKGLETEASGRRAASRSPWHSPTLDDFVDSVDQAAAPTAGADPASHRGGQGRLVDWRPWTGKTVSEANAHVFTTELLEQLFSLASGSESEQNLSVTECILVLMHAYGPPANENDTGRTSDYRLTAAALKAWRAGGASTRLTVADYLEHAVEVPGDVLPLVDEVFRCAISKFPPDHEMTERWVKDHTQYALRKLRQIPTFVSWLRS